MDHRLSKRICLEELCRIQYLVRGGVVMPLQSRPVWCSFLEMYMCFVMVIGDVLGLLDDGVDWKSRVSSSTTGETTSLTPTASPTIL